MFLDGRQVWQQQQSVCSFYREQKMQQQQQQHMRCRRKCAQKDEPALSVVFTAEAQPSKMFEFDVCLYFKLRRRGGAFSLFPLCPPMPGITKSSKNSSSQFTRPFLLFFTACLLFCLSSQRSF